MIRACIYGFILQLCGAYCLIESEIVAGDTIGDYVSNLEDIEAVGF